MTNGRSQDRLIKFHTIEKGNLDVKLSLKFLTQKKIEALEKALLVIKNVGLQIRPDIGLELLDEIKRLRKKCRILVKQAEED